MTSISDRSRRGILALLFVGVLMGALDIAVVGPALPAIRTSFGVDERAAAWIFTIYVLANLVGTPLMAKLSDRFGRRMLYVTDTVLFAAGSLMVALAPSFGVLLLGRAIQGLGAGGIFPVAAAVIGDTFPPERRGGALGLIGAVFGLAFLIGPVLGGVLLRFGWQWLFVVNLPIAAAVVAGSMRLLPGGRPAVEALFDWAGMAALGAALTALAYGVSQIDAAHFAASVASPSVWPFLTLAVGLVPVFVLAERRAADPVLRLTLFRSSQVGITAGLAVGAGLGEAASVFVPAFLVAAFGVSAATASFMLLPVVVALAIGAPLWGRLLDRVGSRLVVVTSTALIALGMAMFATVATRLTGYYIGAVIGGLGLAGLLGSSLRYLMLNEAPASDRASAQAALTIFMSVGQLLGGAAVGAIAASAGGGVRGFDRAFAVIGIVALCLTLLAFGLKGRREELAGARATAG
jgi:EmrB/QacA subfamily drug resistance transporter